jgi:hypothetical protein
VIQELHQDALILSRLSTQLTDPTRQLTKLKGDLTQLSQVAAPGASLLNTIGSILPFLKAVPTSGVAIVHEEGTIERWQQPKLPAWEVPKRNPHEGDVTASG